MDGEHLDDAINVLKTHAETSNYLPQLEYHVVRIDIVFESFESEVPSTR